MVSISTILKHNVIGKMLNHVVVFLINVMIVRLLGAGSSGYYFNELYLLNFIVFVFSAGLDYASIAILSRDPAAVGVINNMLLKVVLFFSGAMLLYVFLLMPSGEGYFRQPHLAIILFSIGNLLLIFFQGIMSALKKFNLQNVILGCSNLLFLLYLFIFYNGGEEGNAASIAKSYSILIFVQGSLMLFFSYSRMPSVAASLGWNYFVRQGVFIMVSSLVYFAFLRVDNFFVEQYEDNVTLGNYVQCGKIGQYFLYFSSIISSTLLPFIATEKIGESFTEWKKMMQPYILLLAVTAICIAGTGHLLFPFFFGADFNAMHKLMLILLPGFLSLGMLTLLNAVYIGKGNIKRIFLGDLLGLALVAGFDSLLVPRYGAYAAAIISSISYCIVFLFLWSGFRKQFLPVNKPPLIQL